MRKDFTTMQHTETKTQ